MFTRHRSPLFWGLALIAVGLAFLLNNLGLLPRDLFNLWPLVVIAAGAWLLGVAVSRREGRGLTGAVVVLALGVFWLLLNFGKVDDQLFLPVLLIALGTGLLLRYFWRGSEA